jgi:hypothetical protein
MVQAFAIAPIFFRINWVGLFFWAIGLPPSFAESTLEWPMLGQNQERNGFNVLSPAPPTHHALLVALVIFK